MKDSKNVREAYVKKILNTIPVNIKPVDYLMDVLNISRESVYRRIRCQVPFSFDEVIELSLKLNFSVEDLIPSESKDKAIFHFQEEMNTNPEESFLKTLRVYYSAILKEYEAKQRKAILSINHLWIIYILDYENLFRFFYYKYMHGLYSLSLNFSLNDVTIPDEVLDLKNEISDKLQHVGNNTYIIDKHVFYNTIKEIQYFYRRGLITKAELLLLKYDLSDMIEYTENQIIKGITDAGAPHFFYLSSLSVYSNSSYVEFDDTFQSFFYEYDLNLLVTENQVLCSAHKKWLESLKKYSVLISASNEALQMKFFREQRKYLNDLLEDKDL